MKNNQTEHKHHERLAGLELLRFISAFSVLVWHYQHFSMIGLNLVDFDRVGQPFYQTLRLFYDFGYFGVQVFWCISGFIFFIKYGHAIRVGAVDARSFLIARFSRLYPLHFTTLIITLILQYGYTKFGNDYFVYGENDGRHFLLQILLASEWGFEAGRSFNGPIWSVSVEVLVYLIFFYSMKKFGPSLWINIFIMIICVIIRLLGVKSNIVQCLAFFYLGGCAAVVYWVARGDDRSILAEYMLAGLSLLIFLIGLFLGFFIIASYAAVTCIFFSVVLFWVAALNSGRVSLKLIGVVETLGNLTYASYLTHFPIQLAIAIWFRSIEKSVPYQHEGVLMLYVGSVFLTAYFVFEYFERPMQLAIRQRFHERKNTGIGK